MADRSEYLRQLDEQLAAWTQWAKDLELKARTGGQQMREDLQDTYEHRASQVVQLIGLGREQMEKVGAVPEEAWRDMAVSAEQAWGTLLSAAAELAGQIQQTVVNAAPAPKAPAPKASAPKTKASARRPARKAAIARKTSRPAPKRKVSRRKPAKKSTPRRKTRVAARKKSVARKSTKPVNRRGRKASRKTSRTVRTTGRMPRKAARKK